MFQQVTAGQSVTMNSQTVEMPRYMDVYNIYHPYGRSIIAILTQNPPGVNFAPEDPMNAADIAASQAAEKFRHVIDMANDRKRVQAEIARFFCTDGRVILYTRSVADEQKMGEDEDGTPNSSELINAFGVLESKLPVTAKDLGECLYVILSDEMDINAAKEMYPDAADEIKEGGSGVGEAEFERYARLGVLQGQRMMLQAGDNYAHLVTRHRVWLRPAAFRKAPKEYQEELKELYPSGVRMVFVSDAYCESSDESMDDHIVVGHPLPGDGMARPSYLHSLVPIQDAFNSLMNMKKEGFDYCIPSTWVSEQVCDAEALSDQISEPGVFRSAKSMPNGVPLAAGFFVEPVAELPTDMMASIENLQGPLAQFVTGALPSLFGGSMEDQKTASGYAMAREQAMGQIGLPWGSMQEMYAKAYKQAVICAAGSRDAGEVLNVDIKTKRGMVTPQQIPIADLQKGNFRAKPDADSSFPETTSAKRQALQQYMAMVANDPALEDMAHNPDNIAYVLEVNGLQDIVSPEANSAEKQKWEIKQLLGEPPILPDPEQTQAAAMMVQAQGQPPPPPPQPEPSVPIDQECDIHPYEWAEVQRWLSSQERREQDKIGNQAGVMNVRLHGLAHKAAMQAAQAAAQAAANPPKPTPPADEVADVARTMGALMHLPPEATRGNIQGQVSAGNALIKLGDTIGG
jgi:hypothetical protein